MKILDLKAYRLAKTQGKTEPDTLDENSPLLARMDGEHDSINDYLQGLTAIADRPHYQFFFELLQNAYDEEATELHIFYQEGKMLAMNNGTPFRKHFEYKNSKDGDRDAKDDLMGFLQIGKGTKSGVKKEEESRTVAGKFGIGSKLLYSLLFDEADLSGLSDDERMEKALIEEKKSLILFSWHNPTQVDELATFFDKKNKEYFTPTISKSAPLLVKPIYSFFPAYPCEEKIINGKKTTLFSWEEVAELSSFIKNNLYPSGDKLLLSEFNKGSLFFLNLGAGVFEKIKNTEEEIIRDLRVALNFFSCVQKIVINGLPPIEKIKGKTIEGSIKLSDSAAPKPYIFLYEPKIVDELDVARRVNFCRFAPANTEKHGFNFHLHTLFDLVSSRQQVKWNENGQSLFKNILSEVLFKTGINYITDSNFKAFNGLFVSLLYTDFTHSAKENEVFLNTAKDQIKTFLSERIPVQDAAHYAPVDKVVIKNTTLPLDIADFDIDKHWLNADIIDKGADDIKTRCKELWKLETWGIFDIARSVEPAKFIAWVQALNEEEYTQFIEEWTTEFKGLEGQKKTFLQLAFLRDNKGEWRSPAQLADLNTPCFPLDSRSREHQAAIERQDLAFVNIPEGSKLQTWIDALLPNIKLAEKCVKHINADKFQLNDAEKWFLSLQKWEYADSALASLKYFKNADDETIALSSVLQNSIANAYLQTPQKYRLHAFFTESALQAYCTNQEDAFLKCIAPNWTLFLPRPFANASISIAQVKQFYDFIQAATGEKHKDYFIKSNSLPCIFTDGGEFVPYSAAIDLERSTEVNTDAMTELLATVNKNVAHAGLRGYFSTEGAPFGLSVSLLDIFATGRVAFTQMQLEQALYLLRAQPSSNDVFDKIYITESNANYYLHLRGEKHQIIADEPNLKAFLQKNSGHFVLLPDGLRKFVEAAGFSIEHNDQKVGTLDAIIIKHQFQRDFAWSVWSAWQISQNSNLKKPVIKYIEKFLATNLEITLASDSHTSPHAKNSFEYVFAEILNLALSNARDSEEKNIKSKIRLFGTLLSSVKYTNTLFAANKQYQLSDILPKYAASAGILAKSISLFSGSFTDYLFNAAPMPEAEVYKDLLDITTLSNISQFDFAFRYYFFNQQQTIPHSGFNTFVNAQPAKCFDIFFELGADKALLQKAGITLKDWAVPENTAIVNATSQKYLSASEHLPTWLQNWHNNKANRIKYLQEAFITRDEKAVAWRIYFSEKNEIAPTQNQESDISLYWQTATLQWLKTKNTQWNKKENNIVLSTLNTYIHHFNDKRKEHISPTRYGLYHTDLHTLTLCTQADKTLGYLAESAEFYSEAFQAAQAQGYKLTCNADYYGLDIKKLSVAPTLDEAKLHTTSAKWKASYYTAEWENEYKFRIFLCEQKQISQKYQLKEGDKFLAELGTRENRLSYAQHKDNFWDFYLSSDLRENHENIIENALNDTATEFDKKPRSQEALIALYKEAIKQKTGSTDRTSTNKNSSSGVGGSADGGDKEGRGTHTLTDKEAKMLEALRKGKISLDALMNAKVKVSKPTGLKGEWVVYIYLCKRYGKPENTWDDFGTGNVRWTSKTKDTPKYDFEVTDGSEERFFDAKTTKIPEQEAEAIPFFVRPPQLAHIKDLKKQNRTEHYILARLNITKFEKNGVDFIVNKQEQVVELTPKGKQALKTMSVQEIEANIDLLNLSEFDPKKT